MPPGKNQRLDRREQLARPRSIPFVIRSSPCQDAGAHRQYLLTPGAWQRSLQTDLEPK
jgi:hypothetical protein